MQNPFARREFKRPTMAGSREENCKIRIKNTSRGKEIEFVGKCSKEQVEMAKQNLEGSPEID